MSEWAQDGKFLWAAREAMYETVREAVGVVQVHAGLSH